MKNGSIKERKHQVSGSFSVVWSEFWGNSAAGLKTCLRSEQVNREQLLLHGVPCCRAGSPDALNGGVKEAKGKGTSQPRHGAAIGLIMLCCNHRGQPLVADGG